MTSDADLLEHLANGDKAAFDAFYNRHGDRVFRFALMISSSRAIAEESTQETFAYVLENAAEYCSQRSPSAAPWLLGVARNRIRTLMRCDVRAETLRQEPSADQTPEELVETSQRTHALIENIGRLSDDHREVLVLCGLLEIDYQTAAEILGVSIGTVRSRLSRARHNLAMAITGRTRPSLLEIKDAI